MTRLAWLRPILIFAIVLILGGCIGEDANGLRFVHDDAHGVGCWYSGYGLDCLPDSEYRSQP